jgi:hypothetical protein
MVSAFARAATHPVLSARALAPLRWCYATPVASRTIRRHVAQKSAQAQNISHRKSR